MNSFKCNVCGYQPILVDEENKTVEPCPNCMEQAELIGFDKVAEVVSELFAK